MLANENAQALAVGDSSGNRVSRCRVPCSRRKPQAQAGPAYGAQVSLRNPKSGDEIKAMRIWSRSNPETSASAWQATACWMVGEELQLRRREVRTYNARSGAMEHQLVVEQHAEVALHAWIPCGDDDLCR